MSGSYGDVLFAISFTLYFVYPKFALKCIYFAYKFYTINWTPDQDLLQLGEC